MRPLKGLKLVSSGIKETLGIDVAVLMGANLANDVARERFSEATLGGSNLANLVVWKQLLQTQYFRITAIQDASGVELCGALKNIVATAAGFIDGMFPNGGGDNTKAAIIRRGLAEMRDFCRLIDPSVQDGTFLESCGIADIVTSSYGGRNRRVAEAFVVANGSKSIDVLEAEMLGGMKLQGPPTAQVVYEWLHQHGMLARFPILTGVYYICYEGKSVSSMLFCDPVSNL